ncbi:hypothetical protein T11_11366 [Trichinella zimbabwensis]|uniref:Uncharacterized protein n=1 Tax=Trichinella zimbabwensis TaxID=268475 RepID=A0A0V1HCY3_9BILA|nr:hypothetical protein T11_11366 [Trichinella zimbabwensis]
MQINLALYNGKVSCASFTKLVVELQQVKQRLSKTVYYYTIVDDYSAQYCTRQDNTIHEKEERMQSKHKRKLATSIDMMHIAFGNHLFIHTTSKLL